MNQLSLFIRSKRLEFALNQKDFSVKAGVLQSVLSRIETGRTKTPTLETLARLASAFGLPVEELTHKIGKGAEEGYVRYADEFFQTMSLDNPIDGQTILLSFKVRDDFLPKLLFWFTRYNDFWINAATGVVGSPATVTVRLSWPYQREDTISILTRVLREEWRSALLKWY